MIRAASGEARGQEHRHRNGTVDRSSGRRNQSGPAEVVSSLDHRHHKESGEIYRLGRVMEVVRLWSVALVRRREPEQLERWILVSGEVRIIHGTCALVGTDNEVDDHKLVRAI